MPQYSVGDPMWYTDLEDPSLEGCFEGELVKIDEVSMEIKTKRDGKVHNVPVSAEELYGKMSSDFPDGGYDDMVELPELNTAELNRNLATRFKKDLCYCYTGPTLVAINLFKRVRGVFEQEVVRCDIVFFFNGQNECFYVGAYNMLRFL